MTATLRRRGWRPALVTVLGAQLPFWSFYDLVVLSFAIGMIIYGISLMQLQWNERMPSLGISGAFRYLPLAAGGVLIALFSVERIVLRWAGVDVDKEAAEEGEVPSIADVKEV